MITFSIGLLICLTIYAALQWRLRSLPIYLTAVTINLVIWGTALAIPQSASAFLLGFVALLGGIVLGLIGVVETVRTSTEKTTPRLPWLIGTGLVLGPVLVVLLLWFTHRR